MAEAKKIDFEDPTSILDEEDEETLAAINEGIGTVNGLAPLQTPGTRWFGPKRCG